MRPISSICRAALKRFVSANTVKHIRSFAASGAASSTKVTDKSQSKESTPLSCCPENTSLIGLNHLKNQPPVLAMKDEEYPPWLWGLLKPKVYPDDGPGGRGDKMRLRAANRKQIKEKNFLKTQ
ncbi:hypothetical protein EW145_g387 [Phellinidium pouzarii]|uniref:Large ribosomal subunit protein mL54 n=1 Tax=Phellinidium pouzarii TaxID=167371 RepID=A0A4S4LKC9_9AGAM|nr:hypothetical protein EW145_g387 [Phellinidium pouzarii]